MKTLLKSVIVSIAALSLLACGGRDDKPKRISPVVQGSSGQVEKAEVAPVEDQTAKAELVDADQYGSDYTFKVNMVTANGYEELKVITNNQGIYSALLKEDTGSRVFDSQNNLLENYVAQTYGLGQVLVVTEITGITDHDISGVATVFVKSADSNSFAALPLSIKTSVFDYAKASKEESSKALSKVLQPAVESLETSEGQTFALGRRAIITIETSIDQMRAEEISNSTGNIQDQIRMAELSIDQPELSVESLSNLVKEEKVMSEAPVNDAVMTDEQVSEVIAEGV